MPRTRNGKSEGAAKPKRPVGKKRRGAKDDPAVAPPAEKPDGADEPVGATRNPRMTMFERYHLAERIAEARLGGTKPVPWETIAKREGVPSRTCREVFTQFCEEQRRLGDGTGMPVLNETLHMMTASIRQLAYEIEHGETTVARVSAIRALLTAQRMRIELLAVMGRMPRSFRAIDELAILNRVIRQLVEIVEEADLGPEIVHKFIAVAEEIRPVIEGSTTRLAVTREST